MSSGYWASFGKVRNSRYSDTASARFASTASRIFSTGSGSAIATPIEHNALNKAAKLDPTPFRDMHYSR